MKIPATLANEVNELPGTPGVYQFFDKDGRLIYVGKAKNLKKRVSSYFARDKYENAKTAVLVKKISSFEFILVETELDALLLENNLIKKHQPRYNVLLKDDKTYPWICIRNERFPRVFSTRKLIKDGSKYFGPYASVKMVNTLLDMVHQIFKLRTCNLNLSQENIKARKFKVCLEYQIGNCLGPCEDLQPEDEYNGNISQVREILKGNINSVIRYMNGIMQENADAFRYENAQLYKEKIQVLEKFRSRSVVVSAAIHNVDVFSLIDRGKIAYVNFLKVMNGAIIQSHTLELKKKLDETREQLMLLAVTELRNRFQSESKEVLVNVDPGIELPGINFTVPKIGEKKHLMLLSEKNLMHYIRDNELKMEKLDPSIKTERVLGQLKKDLRLKDLPVHIECFDNSNMQGSHPVAAVSVFRDARPAKKEYRHYNIKTVEGPDDFASMSEVVLRRYRRLLDEKQELPQLVIVDGGKGQLSAAIKSLKELNIYGQVTIIGIAKKLEEIYFPEDSVPLYLDKKGESLKLIQHLRDEVHRFGITHHRKKRNRTMTDSELAMIEGIGEKTVASLLSTFKSVKKVKNADLDSLADVIGKSKAKKVHDHFNN